MEESANKLQRAREEKRMVDKIDIGKIEFPYIQITTGRS